MGNKDIVREELDEYHDAKQEEQRIMENGIKEYMSYTSRKDREPYHVTLYNSLREDGVDVEIGIESPEHLKAVLKGM